MSRNLLIVICIFLVVAFAIAYADLYHRYKVERYERVFAEALAASNELDSEHYQELYYETLSKYHDCENQGENRWE